jgi:hypothetical protein
MNLRKSHTKSRATNRPQRRSLEYPKAVGVVENDREADQAAKKKPKHGEGQGLHNR